MTINPRTAELDWVGPLAKFAGVRRATEQLVEHLEPEDLQLQPMPDASPAKWHLGHTTWFFEHFLLTKFLPGYRPFHSAYAYLFNSYYEAVGRRHTRAERGLLSRPTVRQIAAYRSQVNDAVGRMLSEKTERLTVEVAVILDIGMNHEQQHQELILTDLKYAFSRSPLLPAYAAAKEPPDDKTKPLSWRGFPGGLTEIGHKGEGGFAFDNEGPRHTVYLHPFSLAGRLITNGEYRRFMDASGYDRPEFWLSDGWAARKLHNWKAPLHWHEAGSGWSEFTLAGLRPVVDSEPVTHVSFYEADAFARWANARLPTEFEWEFAAARLDPLAGNFADDRRYHPVTAEGDGLTQMFGDCWEWTASPYVGYPGYRPAPGALGEYNGKFMCNQMVLRGGSCASPRGHLRPTYRNFFPPEARWQFSGFRLARDV